MASSRRTPNCNRFDNDSIPNPPSHDTSVSSVVTEPHVAEPSSRRRVSLSPISSHVVTCEHRASAGGNVSPLTGRKSHNPYMYNVLGDNASREMAQRTSPIPPQMEPPVTLFDSPSHPPQRNFSCDWDDDTQCTVLLRPEATPQKQALVSAPGTTPATPVLGGYMAQAYSSAFPPGHLPRIDEPALPMPPTKEINAAAATQRSRRGGRAHRNQSTSPDRQPATTLSPIAVETSSAPQSPSAVVAPVTSPTSPMMRVYRNGRPVPVPAARAAAC